MSKKEVNIKDINQAIFKSIEEIAKFRKIDQKLVEDVFKKAIIKTFNKKIDADAEIGVEIDSENQVFKIINKNAIVVSDEEYEDQDELLNHVLVGKTLAQKIDPQLEEGDIFAKEFTLKSLPGSMHVVISQTFKQKIVEIIRQSIYEKYLPLKGQLIKGKFISHSKNGYIFELEDGAIGFMPLQMANKVIESQMNKVIDVYIENVLLDSREAQIILSNSATILLKKALEKSIPEIASGEIEIMSISRIPGVRSKIAVRLSPNMEKSGIQEIGSIIGKEGKRIALIQEELGGERIDIIKWSDDSYEFIAQALSPAKVISINYNNTHKGKESYIVVVPNIQNTIAIGKKGANALLAVELTKNRLDIISWDEAKKREIEILWNGNLTEEEALKIESGEKVQYLQRRDFNRDNVRRNRSGSGLFAGLDMSEFDREIADYKINLEETEEFLREVEISNSDVDKIMQDHFESEAAIESSNLSVENKAEMSPEISRIATDIKSFKFDGDLATYAGLSNLDIDDEDWD